MVDGGDSACLTGSDGDTAEAVFNLLTGTAKKEGRGGKRKGQLGQQQCEGVRGTLS